MSGRKKWREGKREWDWEEGRVEVRGSEGKSLMEWVEERWESKIEG